MYAALEDLVELVVDGEYEEPARSSLGMSGSASRICAAASRTTAPEALVLPPREIYRVEAITKSDEPEEEGWTFFLELWTDDGPAITAR